MRQARVLFGSRAVIAGVVLVAFGLILAQVAKRHQGFPGFYSNKRHIFDKTPGWSPSLYDAAVVVAWLSILIGLVWVIAGLIRYWSVQRAASSPAPAGIPGSPHEPS